MKAAANIETTSPYIQELLTELMSVRGQVRMTQTELEFIQEVAAKERLAIEDIQLLEAIHGLRVDTPDTF